MYVTQLIIMSKNVNKTIMNIYSIINIKNKKLIEYSAHLKNFSKIFYELTKSNIFLNFFTVIFTWKNLSGLYTICIQFVYNQFCIQFVYNPERLFLRGFP